MESTKKCGRPRKVKMKKEINNSDCCGEDLVTALTV